MSIFKRKSYEDAKDVGKTSGLDKTLGAFDLILFGLGAIVGTGVFVLTGIVAAKYSGPAVTVSYAIAGVTCIFVALAYTEVATLLPTSGSIYTYSYVAFGEVFAWIIGSIMIIELGFAAATVSAGWSAYVSGVFESAGMSIPDMLQKVPSAGGVMNLPAFLIVLLVGVILYLGTKDSKRLNFILVLIKIAAIFVFIISAAPHFDATNWENFIPHGFDNVLFGSSILFFAFTGFGVLASTTEECKNPKRDLTIGIIGSLVFSTILYIIVGALLTGIVSYTSLDNAQPLATALKAHQINIGSAIVATGAIAGMTTVMMMNIYGMSRIFYVIARDGLLPKAMAKLHPKYDSPYVTLLIFVSMVALLGAFCPFEILGQLASMAALIDYIAVVMALIIFRFTLPDIDRPFKCPIAFVIAPIALFATIFLLFKQIIGPEGELLLTGKIIILWIVMAFILYILRIKLFKMRKHHT